jgi:hypothetical protein
MGGVALATFPSWVETLTAFAADQAHAHTPRPATAAAAAFKPQVFSPQQNEAVIAISELILPQTDTPGAKAARVNEFIDFVLARAPQKEREQFLAGLGWMDQRAQQAFGKPFAVGTHDQQLVLLSRLSELADARISLGTPAGSTVEKAVAGAAPNAGTPSTLPPNAATSNAPTTPTGGAPKPSAATGASAVANAPAGDDTPGVDFFSAIKTMTITGYYTSEPGVRQELGDDGNLFFGEFKGCTHPEHQG